MRTYAIEQRTLAAATTAVVRSTLAASEMGSFIGRALGDVAHALAAERMAPTGPPFARYHRRGDNRFDVEAGFPAGGRLSATGDVVASGLPGGPAAVLLHVGPYDAMEPAYEAVYRWVADGGGVPAGDPWEVYLSDPSQERDAGTWRTEIVLPFRR